MADCLYDSQPERLRRLFDDALSEADQAELAAHLEQCPACCRRLDAMAAKSGYWNDLRLLTDGDEFDRRSTAKHEELVRNHRDDHTVPPGLLEPSSEPGHLGRLGPYDILAVVGRGGMGIVFQARDRALDRLVAIKLLIPGLASTAAARRRFAREAKAAAAVVNEHVVAIHAVDTTPQGVPYLVMQYVAGKSVQDLIDQGEPPPLREILRIGMQAAQGLAAAHAQGLIHRDVKPANILLENGVERVKITDFGLARAVDDATMTQPGVVAGTPRYMAPEQARGDAIDHRADLFSLGSVLYALCTGRAPFLGNSTVATLKRVCEETPTPINSLNPDIPVWLVQIIGRLHAKDAADRYDSAAEIADLLGRCLAHVQQPATVPLPSEIVARPMRRAIVVRSAIAACVIVGALAVVAGRSALGEQVVDYLATVLRLKTPEGFLVVETDDPNVMIKIDGNDLVVMGGGVKELRLPVGSHNVQAIKNGTTIRDELVTITRGGKKTLAVHREREPAASEWAERFPGMYGDALAKRAFRDVMAPNPEPREVIDAITGTKSIRHKVPGAESSKAVLIWNLPGKADGAVIKDPGPIDVLTGDLSEVRTVAFSPDGKTLVSGTKNGTITLWDITPAGTVTEFCTIRGHTNGVEAVAFSPDGKRLGSGGWDHHVKLWDISQGASTIKLMWAWTGTSGGGRPVAFSPDGEKLALGSFDGFMTILQTANGGTFWATAAPRRPVKGVCFSPDGTLVALALGDKLVVHGEPGDSNRKSSNIQVWDLSTRTVRTDIEGWDRQCNSLTFSPDGMLLAATNDDGTTRLYDVDTFSEKAVLRSGQAMAGLDFRRDGKRLATSNRTGNVILWDTATGQRRATLQDAHDQNIPALAFAPSGRILATAGADGTIKLWDVSEPAVRHDPE